MLRWFLSLQQNGNVDEYVSRRQIMVWTSLFVKCGKTNLKIRANTNKFLLCWIHLKIPLNSIWEYTLAISLMNSLDPVSCIYSLGSHSSVLHVKMCFSFFFSVEAFVFCTMKIIFSHSTCSLCCTINFSAAVSHPLISADICIKN